MDLVARSARIEVEPVDLEAEFGRARFEASKDRAQQTCRHKVAYRSPAAARNAEILRLSRLPRELHGAKGRPYACPICGKYHLTTKPLAS
ncbi:MAG TPA: hypothetical protein VK178_05955 [Opitutaceae bacterium]|nr:hypothetical protein [Opitutaceae bacterium]